MRVRRTLVCCIKHVSLRQKWVCATPRYACIVPSTGVMTPCVPLQRYYRRQRIGCYGDCFNLNGGSLLNDLAVNLFVSLRIFDGEVA